jgi:cytoskeletal protein CcmA (bactofilin family)
MLGGRVVAERAVDIAQVLEHRPGEDVAKPHEHQEAVENAPTRRYQNACASALIVAPGSRRVAPGGSSMTGPHRDATMVAPGSAFSGRISGDDVDVHGAFDGEMELSGRVRLAAGSKVKARLRANVVEIDGDFEGEVRAKTLRVGRTARALGLFFSERMAVAEGAVLEGGVNPSDPPVETIRELPSPGLAMNEAIPAEPSPALAAAS